MRERLSEANILARNDTGKRLREAMRLQIVNKYSAVEIALKCR